MNTMKGLEVWYLVKKYLEKEHHKVVKEDIPLKTIEGMPLEIIEKELKALEIIKEKNFDLYYLQYSKDLEMYNDTCDHYRNLCYLTQKEYDLLKEVLL